MPVARSLDLWQEGESDPQTGLPVRRSIVIPEGYAPFATKKRRLLGRLKTFFKGLKSKLSSRHKQGHATSSLQQSQQHSSFRRSMIASARLEKEQAGSKAPDKLPEVPYGSAAGNQVVWWKERSLLTEGHPVLRENTDVHIPSEYDTAIDWTLDRIVGPNDSQISLIKSPEQ